MTKDPYQVLGVSRSATSDEIKRAFHKLAHQHHPDKGGNAEKFKEISAAYASLKDHKPQGEPERAPFTGTPQGFGKDFYGTYEQWKASKKRNAESFEEKIKRMKREAQAAKQEQSFWGSVLNHNQKMVDDLLEKMFMKTHFESSMPYEPISRQTKQGMAGENIKRGDAVTYDHVTKTFKKI